MKSTPIITARARVLGLAIAIVLGGVSAPAFAQEMDHSKMQMPAPEPTPAARKPEPQPSTAPTAAPKPALDRHAGHVMPAPNSKPKPTLGPAPAQAPPVDHAAMGHDMPPDEPTEEMDHSAMGHDMESMTAEGHAGMQGQDLPANAAPREPIPAVTDSDREAAFPDVAGHTVHDDGVHWFALLNRLETWDADEGDPIAWEGTGWIGTDLDRVWVRSEGESIDGSVESADVEVLYGRAIARWWDLVAGVRHDFGEGPSQTFAAVGVMGLAPYMFEVEATAYFGQSGQSGLGLEAEYETLFTNRLIGTWLVEAEVWGQDDRKRGIGSGLSTLEAGFRLRYEFHRQFAPYIGVVWERAYGGTADYRREQSRDIEDTRVVAGVRIWF